MSDLLSSVLRLERYGSEDSEQTEKLIRAAQSVARRVADLVGLQGCALQLLPRGYLAGRLPGGFFLVDPIGCSVSANRQRAFRFATDIATGWLDELAEWLREQEAIDYDSVAEIESLAIAVRNAQARRRRQS